MKEEQNRKEKNELEKKIGEVVREKGEGIRKELESLGLKNKPMFVVAK